MTRKMNDHIRGTRVSKRLLIMVFAGALFSAAAHATTWTAASCSETDVARAIASAVSGDTVVIPTCTSTTPGGANTWTSTLTISVPITLEGQDSPGGTGGGTGHTVLIDNVTKTPCVDAPLISLTASATTGWRLTAFTIQGDAPDPGACSEHLELSGGSHSFRVDHIAFTNMTTTGVITWGDLRGVADHNTFSGASLRGYLIQHDSWGGVGANGDNSWAQPDDWGSADAFYVENNDFTSLTEASDASSVGCQGGGRCVIRFNTNISVVGAHGTDTTQRQRGMRHEEVYNNTFNDNRVVVPQAGQYRSGAVLEFNNTFATTQPGSYGGLQLFEIYREVDGWPPWGPSGGQSACDGNSPFDDNSSSDPYVSGTATSGTSGDTLQDTSKSWTANQWVGYSLYDATRNLGATIQSNTSNTLTTYAATQNGPHNWALGDTYQINYVYPCLDQPGRGAGNYISGSPPTPAAWPAEVLDPAYGWNNSFNGTTQAVFGTYYTHVQANRDFYDYVPSFNGTQGTGVGTLASRPATCTVGVAYWATDQGNWNQSGSGGQGELFVCTATNTWTLYYEPYQYPHPLDTTGTPPNPPTNLTATPH